MRITGISAYRVELPLHEGSYKWSGGNSVEVFDSRLARGRASRRLRLVYSRHAQDGRSVNLATQRVGGSE